MKSSLFESLKNDAVVFSRKVPTPEIAKARDVLPNRFSMLSDHFS